MQASLALLLVSGAVLIAAQSSTQSKPAAGNKPNTRFGPGHGFGQTGGFGQGGFGQGGFGQVGGFGQAGGFGQVGGFPGQVGGFPGQVGGFPGQVGGFPGQVGGFPGQVGGFPGQVGHGGGVFPGAQVGAAGQGNPLFCPPVPPPTPGNCNKFIKNRCGHYVCSVDQKPFQCPRVRPQCPGTRTYAPPRVCLTDNDCGGFDKCCPDACLPELICKSHANPTIFY